MRPKIVFSDFDGTLTINNELGSSFFQLLDFLNKRALNFVIVSGRSLSWGHFLLTHFPINLCIMEGGGVIVRKGNKETLTEEILVSSRDLIHLENLEVALKKKFPRALAPDSFGRKTDRSVDLGPFDEKLKSDIKYFIKDRGAQCSLSNIHLNFWYGDVSKYNAIQWTLQNDFPEISLDDCLYFGDALNDQSVFKSMKHTVGVSNISLYLDQMDHHPEVILTGPENHSINGVYNFLKSLK